MLRAARAAALKRVYTRLLLSLVDVDLLADRPVAAEDDVRLLTGSQIDDFLAFRPESARAVIAKRLAAGHECVCLWGAGGIVSAIWLRYDVIWLPEVREAIPLPPGVAYAYDSFTTRAHRHRGLVNARAPHTGRHLQRRGFVSILGYVRAENAAGLAATRSSGARPVATLTWLHLGPAGVETMCSDAGRRRTRPRVRGSARELQAFGRAGTTGGARRSRGAAELCRLLNGVAQES